MNSRWGTLYMLLCSALTVVGFALFGLNAPAASARSVPTARPEFEVASIKPHITDDGTPRVSMKGDQRRINDTNVTVRSLIRQAYGLKVYPLSGPSDALSTERYDIVATVLGDASKERTALMLQSLLAERFKLVLHRETKELPVYALVVGKTGIKVREVQDDGGAPEIGSGGGHQIRAHHISMKALASSLQAYIGDPIVDTTGLGGLYDLNLDFTPDESMSADGENIFEAIQRQLGLKLERRKGPVEVVVIDHVERLASWLSQSHAPSVRK
jgi:uncharacterized protein (TIGR03435 family)